MSIETIKNKIFKLLSNIRLEYLNDPNMVTRINSISNDLLENNIDSLISFANEIYNTTLYSDTLKTFVQTLISSNLISQDYLNLFIQNATAEYQIIESKGTDYNLLVQSRPLNLKPTTFTAIKAHQITIATPSQETYVTITEPANETPPLSDENNVIPFPSLHSETVLKEDTYTEIPVLTDLIPKTQEEIDFPDFSSYQKYDSNIEIDANKDPKFVPLSDLNLVATFMESQNTMPFDPKIDNLIPLYPNPNLDSNEKNPVETTSSPKQPNKILEVQLAYFNDPVDFISKLETMSELEVYDTLHNLGDIRFMQHSLSYSSDNLLDRLLIFLNNQPETIERTIFYTFFIELLKKIINERNNEQEHKKVS